jgi:hypothetical protein
MREKESIVPGSLAAELKAAMGKRESRLFFENLVTRGGLKPKWHSHFGNNIVNTLLALHKFQAKKQVSLSYNL